MMKYKNISPGAKYISGNKVQWFQLKLFVTGASPNSSRAVAYLKSFCEKYLGEKYELEIIDVYQQPFKSKDVKIMALPMLLKYFPLPVKKLIGDLSDTSKMLKGLGLNPELNGWNKK
ncbi:MAG: circadian clock KaiB family protein [Ginsengibacter sp.]